MHDPMTQAFSWPERNTIITIWHVDPETDGSDDSCGYTYPKLSKDQLARISILAREEANSPYYQALKAKALDSPTEVETLLRQAFLIVGKMFSKAHLCEPALKPVTFAEASRWACQFAGNPMGNFRSSLAFLPGYHSNSLEDHKEDREYCAKQFFAAIGGHIARERRPWYRHPKWHFWHWQIQIHPLQAFQRWAFTRCADCGGRFKWGESGWTNSWNSTGPRWFKSEQDLHHERCGSVMCGIGQKSENRSSVSE